MFLEIFQNSHENTCARVSFLIKPATLLKKRLWRRYFPMNFVKFLGKPFLQNTSGSPLLSIAFHLETSGFFMKCNTELKSVELGYFF